MPAALDCRASLAMTARAAAQSLILAPIGRRSSASAARELIDRKPSHIAAPFRRLHHCCGPMVPVVFNLADLTQPETMPSGLAIP